MAKATLMVRFKRPTDDKRFRKPAVKGGNGRWLAGKASFKNKETGKISIEEVGENYTFEVRVEDGGTTCKPVGGMADFEPESSGAIFPTSTQMGPHVGGGCGCGKNKAAGSAE